jgi:hypothetical protein
MTSKILIAAFLIASAGIINSAKANDSIPPVHFECLSNSPDTPLQVQGTFQEANNRHGAGHIDFTVSTPDSSFKRSGKAHTSSVDEINYSDDSLEIQFMDVNYYASNVSTFKLDGQTESMSCRFTSPESTSSSCNQWWCHHNTH